MIKRLRAIFWHLSPGSRQFHRQQSAVGQGHEGSAASPTAIRSPLLHQSRALLNF